MLVPGQYPQKTKRKSASGQAIDANFRGLVEALNVGLRAVLPAVLIAIIQNAAPPEVANADVAVRLHIFLVDFDTAGELGAAADRVLSLVVGLLLRFDSFVLRKIGFRNVVNFRFFPASRGGSYQRHNFFSLLVVERRTNR